MRIVSIKTKIKSFIFSSSWRNLDTISLENIVKQLLTFSWDHFSYNVEVLQIKLKNIS